MPQRADQTGGLPVDQLGTMDEVARVAQREREHAVALAGWEDPPGASGARGQLKSTRVDLMVAPAIIEVAGTRIHARPVARLPLMYVDSPTYRGGKGAGEDCVLASGSAIGLLVA